MTRRDQYRKNIRIGGGRDITTESRSPTAISSLSTCVCWVDNTGLLPHIL
ncbi:hypothetical protein CORMATOL_03004 [Corynebacterium matruchotii ATCC 33806]|uniref:Uncharacterized protein n=1 Tax=Corynebacterium matruchotii ATCC 33806 TaxID=566549 RepID=C0E7L5_9CORY|nr:hypothetical protein CORMATOL_03004 [Corynebacterium matruchotii ATCC 33806]